MIKPSNYLSIDNNCNFLVSAIIHIIIYLTHNYIFIFYKLKKKLGKKVELYHSNKFNGILIH